MVKTGQAWAGTFVCLDATGALEAGTPSGVLYVDGVADAATVTITGSNPYKWAVTLPSLTAGQRVDMYITATISTIATAAVVASEQADTALVSEVKAETALIVADTGTDGVKIASGELSDLALEATLTAMKGAGWTDETLVALMTAIEAISAGSGATAQEVWEYTTRVLTAGTNIDISSLATAANLAALDGKVDTVDGIVDAILADTNELQTDLTDGGRLDLLIDAIKTETDSQATAAEVWAYTPRTLTNAGTTITNPADGDPLYIYNNQTVIIELTDLGSVAALTAAGDKVWFTIKENLDDPDTNAILHIITTAPGDLDNDASTLTWVNGAAPISATGGVLAFTDVTAGDVTITLDAAEAANMPIYAVTPVYWDIKSLDYSSGVVTILQTGTAYIYNSSTKTIA